MIFCIFSFNRGRFLANCVDSIERCVPSSDIIIFDDDSDDPETIAELNRLSAKYQVQGSGKSSNNRLGGLYGNMQRALEVCRGEQLVCFLQDDTQVVRAVDDDQIDAINGIFDSDERLGFLSPCFVRGRSVEKGASFQYDQASQLFFRNEDKRSAGRYFSALLMMRPERLIRYGWRFEASEPANEVRARELFLPMGYLKAPFAMWLPEVPAYRGKKKTLGLKLAEKKRNCGFYPFRIMSEAESLALAQRSPDGVAIAEDYLECTPETPPKPWAYNPLTDTGWRKLLSQLEVSLRKVWE